METTRKRLGDLLVESHLLSEEQLQIALQEKSPGQRLGDALLQRGFITEQQLIEVLEFQLGIPHINLFRYPFDTNLVHIIPRELAKKNILVPLKVEEDTLFVAMADPMDYLVIDDLRLATGFRIETAIASKDDILRTINKYYEDDSFQDTYAEESTQEEQREEAIDASSPIVQLVNQLLSSALTQKASDMHIDPQEKQVNIRYRIDGLLKTERVLPKHLQAVLITRIKIMANLDITEVRLPQDGRIKTTIDFRSIDLRVSTIPTVYGEKVVLRILDLSANLSDLAKIGLTDSNYQAVQQEIKKPNGIILVSGPTGSGKSSTLYAMLNELNNEEVNIITVEDPVEYQLEGINQIQVNHQVGLTFTTGLRSILRQDPDVVMIGEIRDKETVEIAIRASLTGHLVLSTIHTNEAVATIGRLLDMGVEPFLITASLNAIIAQRLIRRVCRDCGVEQEATIREKELFLKHGLQIETVYRGTGCPSCNLTGYRGRIAIHEVLLMNDELRKLIHEKATPLEIKEAAERQGLLHLLDDGLVKVQAGITTTEEVLRVTFLE